MTDHVTDMDQMTPRARREPGVEYKVYFSLIFLAALPFAAGGVALSAIGIKSERRSGGMIRRALAEASEITTMIFSR
ncbi:MAG: protein pufQ [Rhodobacteraceae bacterium]|nr:protein pufQ [Paracoccaceae bacterium]